MANEQAFVLAGDLDATEVANIYALTRTDCRAGRLPSRIDLGELGQTDSSVLALMLDWQSHARAHDSSIDFQSPPDSLRVLASLSQVSELLGWKADTSISANGESE